VIDIGHYNKGGVDSTGTSITDNEGDTVYNHYWDVLEALDKDLYIITFTIMRK